MARLHNLSNALPGSGKAGNFLTGLLNISCSSNTCIVHLVHCSPDTSVYLLLDTLVRVYLVTFSYVGTLKSDLHGNKCKYLIGIQ
jgi:hypothetical protein